MATMKYDGGSARDAVPAKKAAPKTAPKKSEANQPPFRGKGKRLPLDNPSSYSGRRRDRGDRGTE